jgi:hypothetical protein
VSSDVRINRRIISKIKELDEPNDFKKLLLDLLEFEKIQIHLGDKEYTMKYDGMIGRYLEDKS